MIRNRFLLIKDHIEQLNDRNFAGTVEREGDHGGHQVAGLVAVPEREPDPTEHVHVDVIEARDSHHDVADYRDTYK